MSTFHICPRCNLALDPIGEREIAKKEEALNVAKTVRANYKEDPYWFFGPRGIILYFAIFFLTGVIADAAISKQQILEYGLGFLLIAIDAPFILFGGVWLMLLAKREKQRMNKFKEDHPEMELLLRDCKNT